ncbi:MAG: TerB family tellurite resistance protein [Gammaproteobacteria bacterium]|nr:TerB family tellurite resistance protein [Gammaproteobacteria bacterium]NNF49347.1 hypothetical protein [Woeseiaceae bacterium]MBT8093580.1 TerB family tellurite resistance protein [Gammaproteobacteria bacterium]MBT8106456.1 TerB family tellurite resistance protein [Gammaproteobacteria bacterium]NNK26471.1 hypothetical protein [Woeseiaceae bacterium]
MAISDLANVLNVFGGSEVSAEKQQQLFEETLLMTLARAANADVSIQRVEVERVQAILKKHTGKDFSVADVRVAAREELYAEATLVRYLRGVEKKLSQTQCSEIVVALTEVFRSDDNVSALEVDFFNNVVNALNVTPAQIAGLTAGDV